MGDHLSGPIVCQQVHATFTRDVAGHHIMPPIWSYSRWGLHSHSSHLDAGELLPHLSTLYLTIMPLYYALIPQRHQKSGGIFLLHFPWSRLHWVLPSTLPYGARTFLQLPHICNRDRLTYSHTILFCDS